MLERIDSTNKKGQPGATDWPFLMAPNHQTITGNNAMHSIVTTPKTYHLDSAKFKPCLDKMVCTNPELSWHGWRSPGNDGEAFARYREYMGTPAFLREFLAAQAFLTDEGPRFTRRASKRSHTYSLACRAEEATSVDVSVGAITLAAIDQGFVHKRFAGSRHSTFGMSFGRKPGFYRRREAIAVQIDGVPIAQWSGSEIQS